LSPFSLFNSWISQRMRTCTTKNKNRCFLGSLAVEIGVISALYLVQARFYLLSPSPLFPPFESCYRLTEPLFTFKIESVSCPTWISNYRNFQTSTISQHLLALTLLPLIFG
ncbi:MAG: hypothetical protein ACFFBD_27865, partial [Candidatus Hodarchaeota archaeon]